ncbi:tetratricopeptide repeat protein [Desulfoluna butyratoxydans]|uniref:Tpr repeat n=1 Tax=Desulfoluna butyratoxydans TaxID=231438 RepID=A0A4U8YTI4_9BACT|nr:tetratricopeptide repeat protein [Desulfoluna butyratoxydans]VFQ46867.1 tpr repeat [Desulfoluna butyratoxydans]
MKLRLRAFSLLILWFLAPVMASAAPETTAEYQKMITEWSDDISKGRNLSCAYYQRGLAHLKHQEFKKAIGDFQNARQFKLIICKNEKGAYGINMGHTHYLEGICWYELNTFDQAISRFDNAVATDGYIVSRTLYYLMGKSFGYQSKFKDAISAYDKAIAIDPKYAEAYFARGLMYGRLGLKDKERQDKSYSRRLNPDLTAERDRTIVSELAFVFSVLLVSFLFIRTISGMLFKTPDPVLVKGRPSYIACFIFIFLLSIMSYAWWVTSLSSRAALFSKDPQWGSNSLFFFATSFVAGGSYLNLLMKRFILTKTHLYIRSIFGFGRVRQIKLSEIRDINAIGYRWPSPILVELKTGKRHQIQWLHDADGLVDRIKPLLHASDTAQVGR